MAEETLKIGIIGAGRNTRKLHIPNLQALPGVEILEVANRSLESGKKVAEEFSIPTVRENWRDVATSSEIDAVVIGTWPYLHCEATCLALKSGKHVLCEARMAMSAEEAETMLRTSLDHPDLVAQLVPAPFTFRIDKTIADYIDGGLLGRPLHFQVNYLSNPLTPPGEDLHWRRDKKYTGVNTMVLGIVYESLRRWLPPAKWVSTVGHIFNGTARDPENGNQVVVEVPDYLSVQMQLTNGMLGAVLISEAGPSEETPTVKIIGNLGTLTAEFIPKGRLWFLSHASDQSIEVDILPENENHWRVEEEFINAIRGTDEIQFTPFSTGVEYMKFTEAVIQSWHDNGAKTHL